MGAVEILAWRRIESGCSIVVAATTAAATRTDTLAGLSFDQWPRVIILHLRRLDIKTAWLVAVWGRLPGLFLMAWLELPTLVLISAAPRLVVATLVIAPLPTRLEVPIVVAPVVIVAIVEISAIAIARLLLVEVLIVL